MVTYVVDTSVIARLNQPRVMGRVSEIGSYNCRVPAVVMLEIGCAARNRDEYERRSNSLISAFTLVTTSPWAQEHALHMQRSLVISGEHRSARLGDLLIAATAIQLDATVLHYDRDFDTLHKRVGVPMEWVAPAGSLDGQSPTG